MGSSAGVRRLALPVRLPMLVPNPKSGWTIPFSGLSLNEGISSNCDTIYWQLLSVQCI